MECRTVCLLQSPWEILPLPLQFRSVNKKNHWMMMRIVSVSLSGAYKLGSHLASTLSSLIWTKKIKKIIINVFALVKNTGSSPAWNKVLKRVLKINGFLKNLPECSALKWSDGPKWRSQMNTSFFVTCIISNDFNQADLLSFSAGKLWRVRFLIWVVELQPGTSHFRMMAILSKIYNFI